MIRLRQTHVQRIILLFSIIRQHYRFSRLLYIKNRSYLFRLEHYNFIHQEMNKTANLYSPLKHKYHAPLSQRFPEDIQCIIQSPFRDYGSLYISNIQAAENPATLQRLSIKAVLSCAKGYQLNHSKIIVPHYLYIAAVDHQNCDISPHFDQAVDFIQKHLKTTNVLVHCLAGVSRSVSMVIAYFIRQHNMTDLQAFNFVRSRRKIINPNQGFREQLNNYHRKVSSSHKMIRSDRIYKTPPKRIAQQQSLYKEMPLKHLRTSSTNEKSIKEQSKGRYGYIRANNNSSLLQSQKKIKSDHQDNQTYSRDKHRQSPQNKSGNKYFSPSKIESFKSINRESLPKQQKTKDYFQSLREDLDQRIQKIKQKYDIHRHKLDQKYQRRNIQNMQFQVKYTAYPTRHQNEVKSSRLQRLKTLSYHQHSQQPNYLKQTQRQHDEKRYPNVDDLFPRKFHIEENKKSIEKNPTHLNNTSLLNNYSQANIYRPKNNDLIHHPTFTNLKNSINRNRY